MTSANGAGDKCNGHGHTHGNWCHCDEGFVREPADPMSCANESWNPCETSVEGDFIFQKMDFLPSGIPSGIGSDASVAAGSELYDVYGALLHTIEHPDVISSFGSTAIRGVSHDERVVGGYCENCQDSEGVYGFRWENEVFEVFDAYKGFVLNTSDWSYRDQTLTAENANGDVVGHYWDDGGIPSLYSGQWGVYQSSSGLWLYLCMGNHR